MAVFFAVDFGNFTNVNDTIEAWTVTGGNIITRGGLAFYRSSTSGHNFTSSAWPTFPAAATTMIFQGFAYIQDLAQTGPILKFKEGSTVHMSFESDGTGKIVAKRAGTTTLGTSTTTMPLNAWFYLQIKVVISDTVGVVVIRMEGVEGLNLTGQDTRNGGTGIIDGLDIYSLNNNDNSNMGFNRFFVMDGTGTANNDITTSIVEIATINPNGAGATTGWTPSTGANWQTVDEVPKSETDYNSAAATALKDTFAMESVPGSSTSIQAVVPFAIGEKQSVDVINVHTISRHSTSESAGANVALKNASMSYIYSIDEVNPSTAAAWTVAEVNAMEAGYASA